jgi:hypothetical protein
MCSRRIQYWWLAVILLITLLWGGFLLSQRKVLWTDEIYTQKKTIDAHSYSDILTLNILEGNKSPLFYIIQKATCAIGAFKLPGYTPAISMIHDDRSQIIMRIPSNIYMSLGLTIIFYFFACRFSLWTGLYALGLGLAAPMVWLYWVEARPYSLWFLLTTIQLCLVQLAITSDEKSQKRIYNWLLLVHMLMALTTIGTIVQIGIVSLMLWCQGAYRKKWTWLIPIAIILFYFRVAPGFSTKAYFFWPHILESVMPEHLAVYAFYGLMLGYFFFKKKHIGNAFFFMIFLLFLASACGMLYVLSLKKTSQFGFFTRYFIYMVSADIIMMTLVSRDLMQWARKNTGLWINTGILLGGLLVCRALWIYTYMLALGLYSHTPG